MQGYTSCKLYQEQFLRRRVLCPQIQEMTSVSSAEQTRRVVNLPDAEWSDDLSGLIDVKDSVEVETIMLAVLSIQEQASQVEAAFVLTQLDSLKADHDHLKNVLEGKELELKTLRKQLKQGKEKFSSLQLEKDLAQAEAAKRKEQLEVCIQFIVASPVGENVDRETKSGNLWLPRKGLLLGHTRNDPIRRIRRVMFKTGPRLSISIIPSEKS